jgi:ABC-2 type transport system permease protein
MAGLNADAQPSLAPIPVSEHLRAIAWLRWRLFVNGLSKGGGLSFAVKFITIPMQAIFVLAVCAGCGAAAYFGVSEDHLYLITRVFWGIAVFSQVLPILTAAAAPPFDFASLIRFPFSYRGYLALRLFYGLLDSHAIFSAFGVAGVFLGMLVADPSLALRTLPALLLFAAVNFLFTRMLLAWIDRWLARRKTREILGIFAILFSLGIQVVAQAPRYFRNARLSGTTHPGLLRAWELLQKVASVLPPSIAGHSIAHTADGASMAAFGNDAVLALCAAVFALLLHLRLFSEYHGENLNEAPARTKIKPRPAITSPSSVSAAASMPATASLRPAAATSTAANAQPSRFGLNQATLAVIDKELRLLLRGSAKIQQLATPLMMAVIFIFRGHATGHGPDHITWPLVSGYTIFFMATMLNNCFGTEGAGLNLYFLAPVSMRDIILGKNIVALGICCIELGLVYGLVLIFGALPPLHNVLFTLEWSVLAMAVSLPLGNMLSFYWPRKFEVGKMRRQNASGAASFISIGTLLALVAIGFAVHFSAGYFGLPGLPFFIFTTLIVITAAVYWITLNRMDSIATTRRESLSAEICKP